MARKNFPVAVKRAALKRSGGFCEGEGPLYGHAKDVRCNVPLSKGLDFDHVNGDSNGGKPTLANCAAVCPPCNQFKNNKHDTPRAAKGKRQSDNHKGIKKSKKSIPSRPKMKAAPQPSSSKYANKGEAQHRAAMAAMGKPIPPRRGI